MLWSIIAGDKNNSNLEIPNLKFTNKCNHNKKLLNKEEQIKILGYNARSISKLENKNALINILKRKNKYDIIMIVETWMTNKSENDLKKYIK